MANVRIKDLTTTAATTASDDFFGVDGTTNGTRKLNAFSPTFGGNLTVSGNAAIGTDVFKIDSTNTRILFGLAAALQGDTVEIAAKSNAGAISLFGRASNNQSVISFRQNGSTTQKAFVQGGDTGLELGSGSSIGLTINSSNNTTLAGNLTVSGTGTSSVAGKLAVGTTAVIGNAQFTLKKATNKNLNIDAAAGAVSGISIYAGTDADAYTGLQVDGDKLYLNARSGGNVLIGGTSDGGQKLQVSGSTFTTQNYYSGASNTGLFFTGVNDDYTYGVWRDGSNNIKVTTNNVTALTLDSSQRCILSGALRLANTYVATPQVSTGYVTIQDSTGTTYKVLVAT